MNQKEILKEIENLKLISLQLNQRIAVLLNSISQKTESKKLNRIESFKEQHRARIKRRLNLNN
jgi:hypothetical protein